MKWTRSLPHMEILNLIIINFALCFVDMSLENEVEMKYVHSLLSWRADLGDDFRGGDGVCLIFPMTYGENVVMPEAYSTCTSPLRPPGS